mgnify:CR=1 FL=1
MKSYLSLIPISAKVHRRQNRMTLLCIIFSVFMVTAVFSMAEMGIRMEQARLVGKHGALSIFRHNWKYYGAIPSYYCSYFLPSHTNCRRLNDFQQYEQQRGPKNNLFLE